MPDKERPTLIEGCLQVGSVGRATHTEIGKVVQILPEKVLAITFVRPSVQDVGMPEVIDRPRWTDLLVSIYDMGAALLEQAILVPSNARWTSLTMGAAKAFWGWVVGWGRTI